jgi:FkbM family methyltransferase
MYSRLKLRAASLLGSLTKRLLGPRVIALLIETDNGIFAVDPEDSGVGRHLRRFGKWAPLEIQRIKDQISHDSTVLIVGAHIGTLAIPIAHACKSVVAIEANPATYRLLVHNIGINSAKNCTPINIAASDRAENIGFLLSRANSGGSKRTPKRRHYAYYYDKPEEILVKAARLDDYLENHSFDVIVMDIEGSEFFALKGMQSLLARCKTLVVEFLPHHLRNVSGVTVAEFLSTIAPHFRNMTIPPDKHAVDASDFQSSLQSLYDRDRGNDGIIFQK